MTIDISNNNPRISYTVAAGVTQTSFAVPFEFFDDSDVNVYVNEVLKTITTDYTISGGDGSTGTVTISVTGPATVTLTRDITIERVTDFPTGIDINRAALNTQLDTLTAIAADLKDEITRNIRVSDAEVATNLTLPNASNRADKLLKFDTEGNATVEAASAIFGGAAIGANYINNTFTGDGVKTVFTATAEPGSKTNIQIYIDGIYQEKASFSISGTSVTFTEAPPRNSSIEFIIGRAITSVIGDTSGVNYNQGGTGSQTRTLESKLQDIVSVKDFGAIGDGVTDDTVAIQAALDSSGDVYFPAGVYIVDGLTTTIKNYIFGVATLKLKPNATSDYVLKVTQNQSVVENITIDGNRSGHSSYSGRGEGLIISGSYCRVNNVTSSNTPIGANADAFVVSNGADNNVISNCISENAGYAGLRNKGDYTVVQNFTATQWESKGIVCSNTAYLFVVDGADLSSTLSNNAMNNLLVDPDVTGNVQNFVCRNVYASGPNNTTSGNCTKIAYVTNAVYEDCTFLSTASVSNLSGIRVQNNNSSLRLINCHFSSLIDMDVTTDELIIDGCTIGDASGPQLLRAIEDIGTNRVVIKDSNFNRATSSYIRLELLGQYCSVDNCTFTGDSSTTNTVNVFAPDHTFNAGYIYFGDNNKKVNMATSLTGTSSRDIQVGLGNGTMRNNHRASAPPTVGDWLQGDVVYNSAPSAGGTVGWVCVTSGTPGTWKTFGTIAS